MCSLEDVTKQLKVVAEGHIATITHLGRIESELHEFKVDTGRQLGALKVDVSAIKTDVADLKNRVGKIENHVGMNGTPPRRAARRKPSKK